MSKKDKLENGSIDFDEKVGFVPEISNTIDEGKVDHIINPSSLWYSTNQSAVDYIKDNFQVSVRFLDCLYMLDKSESIVVNINNWFEIKEFQVTLENYEEILFKNKDSIFTLIPVRVEWSDFREYKDEKLPNNWLDVYKDEIYWFNQEDYEEYWIIIFEQNIIDVYIEFNSWDVSNFSWTPNMIMKLTENNNIKLIKKWRINLRSVFNLFCYDHSKANISNEELLDDINSNISNKSRYLSNDSDLLDFTMYHGTLSTMKESILEWPRDVWKWFGWSWLYIALWREDLHIASMYAYISKQAENSRLEEAWIDTKEEWNKIVLSWKLNPNKQLRVGVFSVSRDDKVDLENWILPANWSDDPRLQQLFLREFDILDIRGAKDAGLNLNTNRFIVIHESAGGDSIIWDY